MTDARICGHGPVRLALLHGWTEDSSAWDHLVARLDPATFTTLRLDARGYGSRRGLDGALTPREYAGDVLDAVRAQGWDRVLLVGHSMSGLAIQEALIDAPGLVAGIIGVAPLPATGAAYPEPLQRVFEAVPHDRAMREQILRRSVGDRQPRAWVEEFLTRSIAGSEPEAMARYYASWFHGVAPDRRPTLAATTVPVHVVVGRHDPSLTAERMRSTWGGLYPAVTVTEIEDAGHYPMREAPDAFASTLAAIAERTWTHPSHREIPEERA